MFSNPVMTSKSGLLLREKKIREIIMVQLRTNYVDPKCLKVCSEVL